MGLGFFCARYPTAECPGVVAFSFFRPREKGFSHVRALIRGKRNPHFEGHAARPRRERERESEQRKVSIVLMRLARRRSVLIRFSERVNNGRPAAKVSKNSRRNIKRKRYKRNAIHFEFACDDIPSVSVVNNTNFYTQAPFSRRQHPQKFVQRHNNNRRKLKTD